MEFSQHGPIDDPALGDPPDGGREPERGTDAARGADEEHPDAEGGDDERAA